MTASTPTPEEIKPQAPADDVYELESWPSLRGASGNYLLVATGAEQKAACLLARFKVDQEVPPQSEFPGVTYLQVLSVNLIAYNVTKATLETLQGVAQYMGTREYRNDNGDKVEAHLIQKLVAPIAIERMSESTALKQAAAMYGTMLTQYIQAVANLLSLPNTCDIGKLILSIDEQSNGVTQTLPPTLYTFAQWAESKGSTEKKTKALAWLTKGKNTAAVLPSYDLDSAPSMPKAKPDMTFPVNVDKNVLGEVVDDISALLTTSNESLADAGLIEIPSKSNFQIAMDAMAAFEQGQMDPMEFQEHSGMSAEKFTTYVGALQKAVDTGKFATLEDAYTAHQNGDMVVKFIVNSAMGEGNDKFKDDPSKPASTDLDYDGLH